VRSPAPLRAPTWRERWHFRRHKRWPNSYVWARLSHSDAIDRYLDTLTPDEAWAYLHGTREEANGVTKHTA